MRASAVSFEVFAVLNNDQKNAALRLLSTMTHIISNLASRAHAMSAQGQLEVVEVVE